MKHALYSLLPIFLAMAEKRGAKSVHGTKSWLLGLGVAVSLMGVIGLVTAPEAHAQLPAPYWSYSAKFVCGDPPPSPFADDVPVSDFTKYATVINIHNPSNVITMQFDKKAVIALSQRDFPRRGEISPFRDESLKPDEALGVDCQDIRELFEPDAVGFIEGFLVIQVAPIFGVPPDRDDHDAPLDVVGVYTARKVAGAGQAAGVTEDVKEIRPRYIPF